MNTKPADIRTKKGLHRDNGGALLIAIFFAAISALTVGSFIKLTGHELRLSNIQFHSNESLNLAESGLEEGLYALNFKKWDGWRLDGDNARFSVRDIDLGSATGEFHALVEDRNGSTPVVTAEGTVSSKSGLSSTKQVRINLRERTYFANGITARYRVIFSGGNAKVDSYLSEEGPYDSSRRRDNGSVASVRVESDAVTLGNGDIWGWVFTGGEMPDVRNGSILGEDSPPGKSIDMDRIARDFTAEFPSPMDPPDPTIHYDEITAGMDLGTPGATSPTVISTNRIKMGDELNIIGPVYLIVDGNASFSGALTVRDEPNAYLRMYITGDFSVSGNGMSNETSIPANMVIFGVNETEQDFSVGGNASWEAAIYAPNADLKLDGGGHSGHMSGAVVGRNVVLNGNAKFHYDENLVDFTDAFGFAMDTWKELFAAEDRVHFD